MERPRLKQTIEPIHAPNGDVLLLQPVGEGVTIKEPDETELALLSALDGSRSLADLSDAFPDAEETIAQLRGHGLIEDAADYERLPSAELERFDRQLRYFSDIRESGSPTPSKAQAKLREARVAILGVGGLGGRTALELACIGIGELRLVDGDAVEMSNLNRQIQYTEADIGRPKATVTAERLRAFNSRLRVEAAETRLESQADLAAFIAGSDFVVHAADWPSFAIDMWVNAACFEAGIPYVSMSHMPPIARIGPLYVPGVTGCADCKDIALRRADPLYDVAIAQLASRPSPAPTLGPACGLTGGLVAIEAMHYLTGLVTPTCLGAAQVYDLRTGTVERREVEPEPDCPVCAHLEHTDVALGHR
jgi:bacteriocin biosynthesis cyclodehydratase domain-containing protein